MTAVSSSARNTPVRKPRRRLEGYGQLSQSNKDETHDDDDDDDLDEVENEKQFDKDFGIELLPANQKKSDQQSTADESNEHTPSRSAKATNVKHKVDEDEDDDMEVIHLSVHPTGYSHLDHKNEDEETGYTATGTKHTERGMTTTATAGVVEEGEEGGKEEEGSPEAPVPAQVRALLLIFFAVYVGIETSYGGWITTYALEKNVTSSRENAAYVASAYWSALTAGRVMAIPLAVYVSTTRMMRIQLSMCVVSSLLVLFLSAINYDCIIFVSICFGYSLSSMFPLAMTLPTDYGYTLDPTTTTLFVVGATLGEGIFPIAVGFLMDAFGPTALTYSMVAFSVTIAILYTGAHLVALRNPPQRCYEVATTEQA